MLEEEKKFFHRVLEAKTDEESEAAYKEWHEWREPIFWSTFEGTRLSKKSRDMPDDE
jgi:hypothetical protein